MNLRDLKIENSYISRGNNNIADSFLNPALKCAKEYKRSVGFFSSGVFEVVSVGITALAKKGGKIKLIASPKLSEADAETITLGYEKKKQLLEDRFTKDFKEEIEKLSDSNLQLLYELISKDILDIKIAVTDECGIYHDKLGIIRDYDNNVVVFYGSANSSYSGYRSNYEKIRVTKGWENVEIALEEEREFDNLWENLNEFVDVYDYTQTAEKKLIEIVEYRNNQNKENKNEIKLRDYQTDAINAWVNNDYHGFYVMATGTGKTWTAIYSAKQLVDEHPCLITICAPYKHLVKQWAEDVERAFPSAKIVLVSSENIGWDKKISDEILRYNYDSSIQIIIITTISSFKLERFKETINKFKGKKLLIVDEAHRFTVRPSDYDYMLGLSATPFSGTSSEKGNELMNYFGGQVFNLPIEEALEKGFLVPYYYKPIFVHATKVEEERFAFQTRRILSCFRNGVCIDPDGLVKYLRNRLRIISMAENKQNEIDNILDQVKEDSHLVVYCGDGRLFDKDEGEEIRHIRSVKKTLSLHGYKPSQFTCKENMEERIQLVNSFNKGEISALAAIRCLDEGINIPSIKSALILSSNDDYREFVQRRGRILRKYDGKEFATIYDVVVLPSRDNSQWATIEFRRFYEYAKLAINWDELEAELNSLLVQYGIDYENIDVYDYDDVEVNEDES